MAASEVFVAGAVSERALSFRDLLLGWRDQILSSTRFQRWAASVPIVRVIARRRSQAVFDLCAGFVYSQVLQACVRLDLLALLAEGPRTISDIAALRGLDVDASRRFVEAAAALGLLQQRSAGRWGLGPLGAPLVQQPWVSRMVEHNALLYDALSSPLRLLAPGGRGASGIADFFSYAGSAAPERLDDEDVAAYSELMAATVGPIAEEVLDVCSLSRCRTLLDVGGGEGVFLGRALERHPTLEGVLVDLPAVIARGRARWRDHAAAGRMRFVGADFRRDNLPGPADAISLVRVLLDQDDDAALHLLQGARRALVAGGLLIVAEPFAGSSAARTVGEVYFAFYLLAMGSGRPRRAAELRDLIVRAGFRRVREHATRFPVHASVMTATA